MVSISYPPFSWRKEEKITALSPFSSYFSYHAKTFQTVQHTQVQRPSEHQAPINSTWKLQACNPKPLQLSRKSWSSNFWFVHLSTGHRGEQTREDCAQQGAKEDHALQKRCKTIQGFFNPSRRRKRMDVSLLSRFTKIPFWESYFLQHAERQPAFGIIIHMKSVQNRREKEKRVGQI